MSAVDAIQSPVPPAPSSQIRNQIANSPLTFSSSSTWAFSAVSHICSTVIESRLARKVSPALRTAGSITRSSKIEFEPRSSGSAVLNDIAVRTISPTGDPSALARQFVAAARPAHALEDLGVDEPLEQRLQMARGQLMTPSQSFGRNRRRARMQRDIDDSGDRENAPSR